MNNEKLIMNNGQAQMFDEAVQVRKKKLTVDYLLELWRQNFIINAYETRIEADFERKRGEELMKKYYEWWSSEKREVIAVEKGFKIDVGGVEISGRIDMIERIKNEELRMKNEIKVIDFKTSSSKTQEETDADLQLSIYAMAVKEFFEEPCDELAFLFLSEDDVTEIVTQRNESQLKDAAKQIKMLSEGIDSKDFHPIPSVGVCRRCPFRGVCNAAAV